MILIAAVFFPAVIFLGYARFTDPNILYFEDLGRLFLPMTHFSYISPWLAYRTVAAPESFLGSATYAGRFQEAPLSIALPWFNKLLSLFSPTSIPGLTVFEWRLTALYMMIGMLGLFFLLARKGMSQVIAAAFTATFPFAGPIFREWQHTPELRGRLLIPLVLLGLDWAMEKQTLLSWLLGGSLILITIAHSVYLYWLIPLCIIWVIVEFVSRPPESRRVRTLSLPALAMTMVAAVLFPMYSQFAGAMRHSAFLSSLGKPDDFIKYFVLLKDNCSWEQLLQPLPWSGAGLGPLFLAGLFLPLGSLLHRAVYPKTPAVRIGTSAKCGLLLLGLGLALSSVPLIPERWILTLVFPVTRTPGLPPSLAARLLSQIFHVSWRTWFVMAYSGGLLFLASFVPAWMKSTIDPDTRMSQMAIAWAIYAGGLAFSMRLFRGGIDWVSLCASGSIMLVTLFSFVLIAEEAEAGRGIFGVGLILVIGTASALSLSTIYIGKVNSEPYGGNLLHAESEIAENVPPEVKTQYFYRVVSDNSFPNLCLYLQCSSLESYPIRMLPDDVFRFFNTLGAINQVSLPYFAHFDINRLSALGLGQLLGLKYWILVSPPPPFLASSKSKALSTFAPIRYYELPKVFARAWSLQHWTTTDSLEDCARSVARLGTAGSLDKKGVLLADQYAAPGPRPSRSAGPASAHVDILKSEPGRILCKTKNSMETVLATNEIYNKSWNAIVDGRTENLLRANCIFLGVAVPVGEHTIEFRHAGAAAN
jgi:hypothetical protein